MSDRQDSHAVEDSAMALLQARQTVLPRRLGAPGPSEAQLMQLLQAAATAPDHGQLRPWRFVRVPGPAREALAEVFAQALLERDPRASDEDQARAREKAHRAPLLLLAVVDASKGDPEIDLAERTVSAGCAIQNLLLMATAQGFGSALTSGKALQSAPLRALFGLAPSEQALCFVNVGTVQSRKPPRPRPEPHELISTLAPAGSLRG